MLDRLKEYKELISIIVFFLSGFVWIQSTFPDKPYIEAQVKAVNAKITTLNCLFTANTSAIEAALQVKVLSDNIDRDHATLMALKTKDVSTFSISDRASLDYNVRDLERVMEQEKDALYKVKSATEEAQKRFRSGACNSD